MRRYIYFAHIPGWDVVKIGLSQEPSKRIQSLSTSLPWDVALIGQAEGDLNRERWLHKHLAAFHVRCEWFQDCYEVRAAAAAVIDGSFEWPAEVFQTPPGPARDEEIIAKRASGMTLQAIGREYGLTRERVRQVCGGIGGPKYIPAMSHAERRLRWQLLVDAVKAGKAPRAVALEYDVGESHVRNLCSKFGLRIGSSDATRPVPPPPETGAAA